jgi:ATP-dependent DNA ligase
MAIKTGAKLHLRFRNDNEFSGRYAAIARALEKLPDETVVDREVVALDPAGRPSFNMLQNYGSSQGPLVYDVFDVLILAGRNAMQEPLETRRDLLINKVLPKTRRADPLLARTGGEPSGLNSVGEGTRTGRTHRKAA